MDSALIERAQKLEQQAAQVRAHAQTADGGAYFRDMRYADSLMVEASGLRDAALSPEERERRDQWLDAMGSARAYVDAVNDAARRIVQAERIAWFNFRASALYGASRAELKKAFPDRFDSFWTRWCGPEGDDLRESWLTKAQIRRENGLGDDHPEWRQDEINNNDEADHGHQVIQVA